MFTFQRSSSRSVQTAFRNVSGQMADITTRAVQKDEDMADNEDDSNYVLVHDSDGDLVPPNVPAVARQFATAPPTIIKHGQYDVVLPPQPPPTPMQTSAAETTTTLASPTVESTPLLPAQVRRVHTC